MDTRANLWYNKNKNKYRRLTDITILCSTDGIFRIIYSSCKLDCDSRKASFKAEENALSNVKKVIAVVSGKGGVGKSMVTSMLALDAMKRGYETAILDADLTGPSIPQAFGVHGRAQTCEGGLLPAVSQQGVKMISNNFGLMSAGAM